MKKIIFILILSILIPTASLAWDDCPKDEVSCEGTCGLFVDTDNDGICDRSQPAPNDRENGLKIAQIIEDEIHDSISGKDLKTKTVEEVADIYQINKEQYSKDLSDFLGHTVKTDNSFQLLHDNYDLEPSAAKNIAESIKSGAQLDADLQTANKQQNKRIYHLLPISLVLVILYIISHILSRKKVISIINHRKLWNILLLINFLISGILGILLIIKINFSITIPLPLNALFWHVETGIAMFAISIFHIIWHWAYLKNMFRLKK